MSKNHRCEVRHLSPMERTNWLTVLLTKGSSQSQGRGFPSKSGQDRQFVLCCWAGVKRQETSLQHIAPEDQLEPRLVWDPEQGWMASASGTPRVRYLHFLCLVSAVIIFLDKSPKSSRLGRTKTLKRTFLVGAPDSLSPWATFSSFLGSLSLWFLLELLCWVQRETLTFWSKPQQNPFPLRYLLNRNCLSMFI